MDRHALQIQEDLNMILGNLYFKFLVTVDMRGAVVVALDADVTVGVQFCVLPLPAVEVALRQRFQRDSLQRLEALAARDAKARVTPIIDALGAFLERLVDLR